ncbi:hypothetical protein HDV57DRAFT_483891 [Trichoderma longibrachiatum]
MDGWEHLDGRRWDRWRLKGPGPYGMCFFVCAAMLVGSRHRARYCKEKVCDASGRLCGHRTERSILVKVAGSERNDSASAPYLDEVPTYGPIIASRIKLAARADPGKRKPFARCQSKSKIYTLRTLRPGSPQRRLASMVRPTRWAKVLENLTRHQSRNRDQAGTRAEQRERLEAKRSEKSICNS